MSQARPDSKEIAAAIGAADAAVGSAASVRRRYHRRKSPLRQKGLEDARQRCDVAVEPLRSWLGMAAWGGIALEDELAMKKATTALRYERRQIDKML